MMSKICKLISQFDCSCMSIKLNWTIKCVCFQTEEQIARLVSGGSLGCGFRQS